MSLDCDVHPKKTLCASLICISCISLDDFYIYIYTKVVKISSHYFALKF